MFEIRPWDPLAYRRQTRRSTLIIVATFALLAMLLANAAVALFGEAAGDNFRWNLGGVLLGLGLTLGLVRYRFLAQPWMAAAIYGWQLKRSLMRITNVMHHVSSGVSANAPDALKLLRFYHLGMAQMHLLDGNSSDLGQLSRESEEHCQRMAALGLDTDQPCLNPAWIAAVKQAAASRTPT
ncbi:DUF3087 family protein [Pseudomonas sp. N040]|uniref:DUF3087 family protein n=1 Tax=Pseudomonas sp. N040 TaxID=2785325 RepID=UPI0018A28D86|nr:DUF3087 family protein [Pseudomonas sp. N040]MBF7731213.1 DUF3087 family protein [Pseudomonas sp. N040]MBW7014856.1 DUF3087 domain-containing protein [Pseudomonas sp. N040]